MYMQLYDTHNVCSNYNGEVFIDMTKICASVCVHIYTYINVHVRFSDNGSSVSNHLHLL